MKTKIRGKLIALFLAAVTTACFVSGCSNNNNPDVTTSSVFGTDEINNAISTTASNTSEAPTVSMKFKEWYESLDSSDDVSDRKDTGGSLMNNLFIVYENDKYPDGFIVSGRTIIPLVDNAIPSNTHGLRLESTGQRINYLAEDKLNSLDSTLAEFESVVDNASKTQLTTLEDRMNLADDESEVPSNGSAVYFNNYKSSLTYEDGIDVVALFDEFTDYATVLTSADSFSFDIYTAAGKRTIVFTLKSTEEFEVSYGDEENSIAIITAKSVPTTSLFVTPDVLEDVFGYQAEIYDGTLNIVTDNKDLFTNYTTVTTSTLAEPLEEGPSMDEIQRDEPVVTTDNIEPADTTPEVDETPAEPEFLDVSYTKYCTGSSVNIRSSYSTSSKSLGKLKNGDKIDVNGFGYANGNEWYRIDYNGTTAYVVTMYFSGTMPSAPSNSAPSSSNPSDNSSSSPAYKGKYTQPDGTVKDIVIDSNGELTVNGYKKQGTWKLIDGKLWVYDDLYLEWTEYPYNFKDTAGGGYTPDTSDIDHTDNSDESYGSM